MDLKINSVNLSMPDFVRHFLASLTDVQVKIVQAVAIIFICLAAVYAIYFGYHYFKNRQQLLEKHAQINNAISPESKPISKNPVDLLKLVKSAGGLIQRLDLSDMLLTDEQFKQVISHCPNLRLLILHNTVSDFFCSQIALLSHLETLILNCSQVTNAGFAYLFKLVQLHSLSLSNCEHIAEKALANLSEASLLQRLRITDAKKIQDADLAHLSKLPCLQEIALSSCSQLTDGAFARLAMLPNLTTIELDGCDINGSGFSELKVLKTLRKLSVGSSKLIDASLQWLQNCLVLEKLDIAWNVILTDDCVKYIKKIPSLNAIRLIGCIKMTESAIKQLGPLVKSLV